jgi:hypothetical protein
MRREGEGRSMWRADGSVSVPTAPVYRWQRLTLHQETITQKRMWPRTKPSVTQLQPGAGYLLYRVCHLCINGRKHFTSSRGCLYLSRHMYLNDWLGHICVCINVWILLVCHAVSVAATHVYIRFRICEIPLISWFSCRIGIGNPNLNTIARHWQDGTQILLTHVRLIIRGLYCCSHRVDSTDTHV